MAGKPEPTEPESQYAAYLEQGIRAAESGQKARARRLLAQAAALRPDRKDAWLWLAGIATDPRESVEYLQRVLAIDPDDEAASEGLEWARRRMAAQTPPTPRPGHDRAPSRPRPAPRPVSLGRPWLVAALVVVIAVASIALLGSAAYSLLANARPTPTPTPTNLERIAGWLDPLEDAWQRGDWTVVITILERVRALEPNYGGLNDWLTAAYTNYGRSLVTQERWEQARKAFDAALAVVPGYPPAQTQVEAMNLYLGGLDRAEANDWEGARSAFQRAYALDSAYPRLTSLLYEACYRHGLQLQQAGNLRAAKTAYEDALAVMPDGAEALAKLAEVNYLLTPPTPTPTPIPPKKIVVDISEQRMYVYEGGVLIYKWVCSTGEPGRDTRTGVFAVQSKIPEAYSSVWRLRMPYWLGIYWAGASENGIHALPINPNGTVLWAGFLGHKVSFGCIILDTPNAKTLYDWAEIGTPVIIQP
ncbi:MAG: L,D-transpeptidase family protein [Anaerolineae bacterium]|nr:L,D-transpeptidase family protein [Anaerolineae bacterium]